MTKQEKERNMKLASYIACALMLGNGLLFAPMAEADDIIIDKDPTKYPDTLINKANLYGTDHFFPKNWTPGDILKFMFTGDDYSVNNRFSIDGGYNSGTGTISNRHVVVDTTAGKISYVYGGYVASSEGVAENNTVTVKGGTISRLYGGQGGTARNNTVIIAGGTFDNAWVAGGNASTSTGNTVAINKNYAGTINILSGGGLSGDGTSEDNVLSIGANGITIGSTNAQHFQVLKLTEGVTFTPGTTPVFTTSGKITKDFGDTATAAPERINLTDWAPGEDAPKGTMILFRASGTDFSGIKATLGEGAAETVIINGLTTSKQTYREKSVEETRTDVALKYKNEQKMYLSSNKHDIIYENDNPVSKVTLGAIAWNSTTPARALTTTEQAKYTFTATGTSATTIDSTNLSFTGTVDSQSMTLLSGASGIKNSTTTKNIELAANITDANGVSWVGTATSGNVVSSSSDGTIKYNITEGTVSSINLGGWSSGSSLSFLTGGWSGTNIAVNTGSFTATPTTGTILTAPTGSSFGTVSGAKAYASGAFDGDTVKGVTLSGNQVGGVKVNDTDTTKLEYVAENKQVTGISLGNVTWGDGRVATSVYDFTGVTGVDASNLNVAFTGTGANTVKATDTTPLLSSAKNLTEGLSAGKSQDISYTDAKGVKLSGTLTGTVSTSATAGEGTVDYTVTKKTLENVDLSNWNGTAIGNIDTSWQPGTTTGIAVDTGTFQTPTTGGNVDILTLPAGGLVFGEVTGDKAYKDGEVVKEEAKNGVALAGTKSGGVKKSDDKKTLTYYTESMNIDTITLDNMNWGTGRDMSADTSYNFAGVGANGVDTSGLNFTFTGDTVNTLAVGTPEASWDLLTHANGLAANTTVNSVSQTVSYDMNNVAALSGTLTGNVTTEAETVKYAVTGKTLDRVDISRWDGTSTGSVHDSWSKLASGISVTGSGFKTPTAVGDYNILTAGSDLFTGAKIDDSIKYQPSGTYSEKEGNITISGQQAKGVKASSDGKALQYSIGEAYIDTVKLGSVTYNKDAVLVDKSSAMYNYSNVKSLDTSAFGVTMTDEQKKTAAANDYMTLVKANNTLKNIAAQDTGKLSYTYTANPGLTVNGAVTGNVSATGGNVLYTVASNKASDVNVGKVAWNSSYARPNTEIAYTEAFVNADNVFFTGVSSLNKGDTMNLVTNFGDSVNKVRGGIFTLDNGKTGKGHAYWDSATQSLVYVVDRGIDEQVEKKDAIDQKETLENEDKKGNVNGGEAEGDGESKDNETTVKKSYIEKNDDGTGGDVNGGTSEDGDSTENKANVEDSEVDGDVTGGKSDTGNTKDNKTDIENTTVHGDVNGGSTSGGNGESTGNETTVGGNSTVDGDVNGGKTGGKGGTKENKVDVKGGSTVHGNVNGGNSGGNGESTGNEATVEGQSQVDGDVIGGKSESGNTNENKANVNDGSTIGGSVIGGKTEGGSTSKNEAIVTGGSKITGNVTGGQNNGSGTSSENKATVTASEIGGDVIGGYSKDGTVSTNEANVTDANVSGSVYGGKTTGTNKPADTNTVSLTGGTVNGGVYGGYSENGSAANNSVAVRGTTIRDYIYGGKSKYLSQNDEVYFYNGSVWGIIGGGCEESLNNLAELSDGTVEEHILGGFATGTDGIAKGNRVQMLGGTVKGSVIGGYGNGTADGNTVYLGGGTVQGNPINSTILGVTINNGGVYGGYGTGSTKNNSVYLYGTADVQGTGLIGGSSEATGNLLNLGYSNTPWTGGDQSVKNIKNFETMNFSVVPWNTSKSAVTITDGANSDLSMTTVSAKNVEFTGVKTLNVNDTMTLLDQNTVTNKATNVVENSDFTIGIAVEGTGTLSKDSTGNVVYNVKSVKASEQTHNTLMGAEATMTTLNVGNDYIGSAVDGLALPENTGKDGLATFAKLGGSKLTQETGSHIDVSTWNAILALGHKNVKKHSTFEYGAFFEYGNGNYTTYNDASQRGDGSTRYTGGGLLAKWYTPKGLYVEGSLRGGTVHEDANSLLRDNMGNAYSYNTDTGYYGFHVGVGRELKLDRHTSLDVYAKYFYNHRNGADFTVDGADYRLDDITSSLLRVGARYTEKRDDQWSFYGGLAYEYEMCGRAYGTVNGVDIRGADIGGGRIRGEIGAFMKPSADTPWGVDLNLTAYAGKKQGIMGSISTVYTF